MIHNCIYNCTPSGGPAGAGAGLGRPSKAARPGPGTGGPLGLGMLNYFKTQFNLT